MKVQSTLPPWLTPVARSTGIMVEPLPPRM